MTDESGAGFAGHRKSGGVQNVSAFRFTALRAEIDRLRTDRTELAVALRALVSFCVESNPNAGLNPAAPHFRPVVDARNLLARLDAGEAT